MNSEIHLINDDDISSFDIGTPAFLDSSWSTSTGESLHSTKQDVQDFVIFIEPTVSMITNHLIVISPVNSEVTFDVAVQTYK